MQHDAHLSTPGKHSRREFLRRAAVVSGAGFAAPWALDLAGLASAAPQNGPSDDYRAIVCLFLYGGNDHYNTFVPNDPTGYAAYQAARGSIARSHSSILPINPIDGFKGTGTFGFAPELSGLKNLFDEGSVAVMSNLGTLVRPISKVGYETQSNRPPQLFSHNDQQSYWQASSPEGATTGWGGRIGDLLLDGNLDNAAFTCMSVAGNAVLMTGRDAQQFQISSGGVTRLNPSGFRSDAPAAGMREIMELQRPGVFPSSYSAISSRALDASGKLDIAVTGATTGYDIDPIFDASMSDGPSNALLQQLRMVTKLIAAGHDTLGLKRQVFFVAMGGFDTHDGVVERHLPLLSTIDSALTTFHRATTSIGMAENVTTFTASDFGRTLVSNGDGSDHGWGGHHIVMGDSVRGQRVYGEVPTIADDGPSDVGRGRLLPSISVDQYAATFASWMGAGSSELNAVIPNIDNYDTPDLGFLQEPGVDPLTDTDGVSKPADGALQPATRIGR